MIKRETFASRVLEYNKWLSHMAIDLPDNYNISVLSINLMVKIKKK